MTGEEPSVQRQVPAPVPIERRNFPVSVSRLAEHESWRKERHRPATYVHKWWARRLGTVFRRLLLDAVGARDGCSASSALAGVVVYDPFSGSGTTLVEAAKLGARVVGRDINPVATLTERQALQRWDVEHLEALFNRVEAQCRRDIDELFVSATGEPVLHYFWVAVASCPTCGDDVELFSTFIFAKHAYPRRFPMAHATCPECHEVCRVTLGKDDTGNCPRCGVEFTFTGPVAGRRMTCRRGHQRSVLDALGGQPPERRMYAKMVLTDDGRREYRAIDDFDLDLYEQASKQLADAAAGDLVVPDGDLEDGMNTRQAIQWGYTTWRSFFNDRQLYCLGRIAAALRDLPGHGAEREALIAAFGKTLEHNNVFCSFKGEGTGPVRSIFHNHVLRPERCSVEGNPWGTLGGSGGFGEALARLQRAHEYKNAPADLAEVNGQPATVTGRSAAVSRRIATSWLKFANDPDAAYVATGDAGNTDLPDRSVKLIVTDPPYVDNVHYSELADFFHVWMKPMRPFPGYARRRSTRDAREVQNRRAEGFRDMITEVWRECARVLVDEGILAFSFHQSQTSGWTALMSSLANAGFVVTATRPVVAEVTTSLAKIPATNPNRIDVIVVCRKRSTGSPQRRTPPEARRDALRALRRLRTGGMSLGEGDVRTAVRAAVLAIGTSSADTDWEALAAAADAEARSAVASFPRP